MKPICSYTCPYCGMVSHNPNDALHRYCGACHRYAADLELDPFYYCKGDRGGWAVRGPDGFVIDPPGGLDKNIAFAIAKVLSGKLHEGRRLLLDLGRLA